MSNLRGASCLITGGAGYIGTSLLRELVQVAGRVRRFSRAESRPPFPVGGSAVLEDVVGDVRVRADVERALVGHICCLQGRERSPREQRTRQSTGESQSLHGNPPVIAGASWPGNYSLLLASCISVDAIPSAGSVVPCAIGGQYPIAAWLADDRDPNACDAGCPEQTAMCSSASFGRDVSGGKTPTA
jgi:hypothetical protein